MPDGEYWLGGAPVRLRDGAVRDRDGRLAGSALTMAAAARGWLRMIGDAGAGSLAQVAAANPARLLGQRTLGAIAPGCAAQFTVLAADGELHCLAP
jgi:N-acetylglucosamine-6-phosphate deacetylase